MRIDLMKYTIIHLHQVLTLGFSPADLPTPDSHSASWSLRLQILKLKEHTICYMLNANGI